jgi:hypothetical protein
MLTPNQFVQRWHSEILAKRADRDDEQLATLPSRDVGDFPRLPEAARQFLAEAGLPKSCAPFLSFDDLAHGLRHVWHVFSPGQWKPEEKHGLENYAMIGSDGSGNPICVDERDGRIVAIEHELLFSTSAGERRVMFVNSSVAQLAQCLLLVAAHASNTGLEAIKQIDESAAAPGTFWSYETMDFEDQNLDELSTKPWWKFW